MGYSIQRPVHAPISAQDGVGQGGSHLYLENGQGWA